MRAKKRRTNDSVAKRTTRKKVKKEGEIEQAEPSILPLFLSSDEKSYCDEHMKTRLSHKAEEKVPKTVIPKVKITCVPLNVEKIIEFENSNVVVNEIKKSKSKPEKRSKKVSQTKCKKSGSAGLQGVHDSNENSSLVDPSKNTSTKARNKVKKIKKIDYNNSSPITSTKKAVIDSQIKRGTEVTNEPNCRKQLVFDNNSSYTQETNLKSHSLQPSIQSQEEPSNSDLGSETPNALEISECLPYCDMDDESAFLELNDINLQELTPSLEDISCEMSKINWDENSNENKANTGNDAVPLSNTSLNSNNFASLGCNEFYDLEQVKNDLNSQSKSSLQATVEYFLSNPQLKYLKEASALKKGLCFTWLSNNYICSNQQCFYSHCAAKLFTKKMTSYSSKFILNIVVSMRNDILFVDVIMAAFKILSTRKIPAIWVTFLVYFVFYVTEPSDSRFLKFWANAARFYCQLGSEHAVANGFASLLSVFSKGQKSEEWKIIEFIKLIKQPPVQVSTNYELLQPVLKLDLPPQFLIEAVESCVATQKDVLKVYLGVVPKISFMTSPIQVIELLLKFCTTLESVDLSAKADDLKWRLRQKIESFKTKITRHDYPLTAVFQEKLFLNQKENDCLFTSQNITDFKENSEKVTLEAANRESNYFQVENNFYNLMAQTVEFPGAMKVPCMRNKNNETQEGAVCERQITRIQQFFCDCQFDLLGKYLNDLRPNILELAAEKFLKFLLQMKISLQQGVDLVRIIILSCKTDSAAKVIASICVTLMLNLVRINEWEKAYMITSLCQEKQINLIEGKVFYFNEFNTITQCRIALLLVEINAYNGNYQNAMRLIKNHFLFSSNNSLWKLTWKAYDETVRVRIVEDFLEQVISKQLTETAYELFISIWKEQKQLNDVVDLRKFVDELIIMLLNEENEEAVILYNKIKAEVWLNGTTVRAVMVTLVRRNHLVGAKSILISMTQNTYSLPDIVSGSATVLISSCWLEEEIFIVFDAFLESLVTKKRTSVSSEFENVGINIQISKPNSVSPSKITPLCLGIVNPSFKDACSRIRRVLCRFNPPLKLNVLPFYLKLDEYSLQVHLHNRIHRNSKVNQESVYQVSERLKHNDPRWREQKNHLNLRNGYPSMY